MRSLFFHIDASKIRCQSIKTTVLAIFVSMFAGCTDLTETPYTFIDPGSYYKTEEQLNTALTGVYAGFRSFASNWALIYQLEIMTEHYSPGHTKQNSKALNAWQNVNQSTTYNFQIWDSGYDVINRANVILGRGEGIDMAEQTRGTNLCTSTFYTCLHHVHYVTYLWWIGYSRIIYFRIGWA